MANVLEVLNKSEVANELLEELDKFARRYNSYEYGLPTETAEMAAMREIVLKWLTKLEAADDLLSEKEGNHENSRLY